MPHETFYFYENWTNTFAKVHRGGCPYCNEGSGFQGRGTRTRNGRWSEAFSSLQEALRAAQTAADQHANREVWEVGVCGYCG